jgi:predicted metal-dependent enzyme (double-stranded beta helix superfamily)
MRTATPVQDDLAGNPVLAGLVHSIQAIHRRTGDPARLAGGAARTLRLFLGHPGLLRPEQRESRPDRYCQHVLFAAPDGAFSIVALVWRVGQATAVHDHVSWCAVGVHQGRELETSFRLVEERGAPALEAAGEEIFSAGSAMALVPPGDIHTVSNPGPGDAISIHIYGADVRQTGTSIRQRYELPIVEPGRRIAAAAIPAVARAAAVSGRRGPNAGY